jgi:stringent starvation protein A
MINLYSDSRCPFSHRARFVLNKKDMDFKIIDVNINLRQDLMLLNKHNETPVLVDDIDKNNKKKDLVLIDSNIICEYIDERFPHPQLMPIEPAEKARIRMTIFHFERELFKPVRQLEAVLNSRESKTKKEVANLKVIISSKLDEVCNMFINNKKADFLFGSAFSLLDTAVLPLLWRLKYYGIPIKASWDPMLKYAQKQFNTPEFLASLTPAERGMQ